MKRILATLLALLCAVAPLAAFAEMQAEATLVYTTTRTYTDAIVSPLGQFVSFYPGVLVDINGNVLNDGLYADYDFPYNSTYIRCRFPALDSSNKYGILNKEGQLISNTYYADVKYLSSKWTMGVVRAGYDALYADVYYNDSLVATITGEEASKLTYANGDYLYFPDFIIDSNGRHDIDNENFNHFYEYSTYSGYGDGMWHWGSGQMAFVPGCTLTPNQVLKSVYFDGKGSFLDLQGNVLFTTNLLAGTMSGAYEIVADNYIIVQHYNYGTSSYVIDMFDLQGNSIIQGSEIASLYSHCVFASGYQLYADTDGYLHYVDASGEETTSFTLHKNKCSSAMQKNLPFLYCMDDSTGEYVIYSAAAGRLPETYEEVVAVSSAAHVIGVVKNGMLGVIDMYGNTVIDFKYHKSMSMNFDGTMVVLRATSDFPPTYHVYRIDYTEPAAEEASEAAAIEQANPAIWHCDACNRDNDMNFCPGCGTARPKPLPVCSSCGYEAPDASYRFCPNCGQAF